MTTRAHNAVARTASALLLFAGLAQAQDAPVLNENFGEMTAYQVRSDDCALSGCGFISEGVIAGLYDLNDLRTLNARGDATFFGDSTTPVSASKRAEFLRRFDQFVQTVYLDFDSASPTTLITDLQGRPLQQFPSHQYTQAERDAIQARLEADYRRFPTLRFTQLKPAAERSFSTLSFSCGFGNPAASCIAIDPLTRRFSILFGRADNIDFLNAATTDRAFIQGELADIMAAIRNFAFFTQLGIPLDPNDPVSIAQAVSTAVVNQVASTAAHELGHLLGLRHHDSFGAPGDGLPTTGVPRPDAFIPMFDRGQNASETNLHLMASGSTGAPLAQLFGFDAFFGEREATKLLASRFALRQPEARVNRRGNADRDVLFSRFLVPNTVLDGENAGSKFLDVKGALITEASIDTASKDTYRFRAKAGEYINAETVSFTNNLIQDNVITNINLYAINADGTRTLVALNAQSFESFDPLLLDVQLPRTGEYEIEIVPATQVVIGPIVLPLVGNNAQLTSGNYELIIYMVNGPLGRRGSR